jgi:hypothetical protein
MNNIVRSQSGMPMVGQRDGNWIWDGSNWVCDPDCDFPQPFPPFGPPVFSGPAGQPPWYPGANGGVSFGAVAPPNPVRGHLWWNGVTFFLFDGAAWVPVGGAQGGSVTPPSGTPPANPAPGQQWFNGSTLFVWDGNAWIPVSATKTYIQATAPPAPNPGDTWWDGVQFHIWDGSMWELVGPGATVGPVPTTTHAFAITVPTALSLAGGSAWTAVPYTATPIVDAQTAWDAPTKKLTPKKAGVYLVLMRGSGTVNAGGTLGGAIAKNDSGSVTPAITNLVCQYEFGIEGATPISNAYSAMGIVNMNGTTDFLRHWAFSSAGTFDAQGSVPTFDVFVLP